MVILGTRINLLNVFLSVCLCIEIVPSPSMKPVREHLLKWLHVPAGISYEEATYYKMKYDYVTLSIPCIKLSIHIPSLLLYPPSSIMKTGSPREPILFPISL